MSQDIIISEADCGEKEGRVISTDNVSGIDSGIGGIIKGKSAGQRYQR